MGLTRCCRPHLKLLLFAGQVCLQGLNVAEVDAAPVFVVLLVMLALHHLLIRLAQLLLLQDRKELQ